MSTENKFKRVLAATNSESILAVIEGLPVDANGFFMSEEQLTAVEENLSTSEAAVATANESLAAMTQQRDDQALQAQQAVAELATANATITARDAEIARLNAEVTKLEGSTEDPKQTRTEKDKTGDGKLASWKDPKNPANAAADKFFGGKRA